MPYFPRDLESTLKETARRFRVVALTGARQTGKSTLLHRLFGKTHGFVSLDDPRDLKLAQDDPELFFKEHPSPLIIDEIQYAPQLLPYIKLAVDRSPKKGQFLFTGSQQFTMMRNLRETLAGRVALLELYPFSIHEGPRTGRTYEKRCLTGSYPELWLSPRPRPQAWYASYVSTYVERDVQFHYRLEQPGRFRDLILLLAARTAQVLNLQSLSNDLGVSIPTLKKWVRILEISRLIYLLRPYHTNLGSRLLKSPKLYFTDIGLVCHLTGIRDNAGPIRGPLAGALFENFVVQELLKYYAHRGRQAPLFFYRNNHNLEVDLVIETAANTLLPLEIKLNRTPHPGMAHAIERLRNLNKKNIRILSGYVVAPIDRMFTLTRTDRAAPIEIILKELH